MAPTDVGLGCQPAPFLLYPLTMRLIFRIAIALITLVLSANSAFSQTKSLDARIHAEIDPFKGTVYLFAKNLDTGETYSFKGDERVKTASTIKVAVMIEALALRKAGQNGAMNWS